MHRSEKSSVLPLGTGNAAFQGMPHLDSIRLTPTIVAPIAAST